MGREVARETYGLESVKHLISGPLQVWPVDPWFEG